MINMAMHSANYRSSLFFLMTVNLSESSVTPLDGITNKQK